MDWLGDDLLAKGLEEDARMSRSSNAPFDYESFIPHMFQVLGKTLKNKTYERKRKTQKSDWMSQKYSKEADIVMKTQRGFETNEQAAKLYTMSAAYALPGSGDLAEAYRDRSQVLLRMDLFEECADDIQRAMSMNPPECCAAHLLARKAECYAKLAKESYINAKAWLRKIPINDHSLMVLEKKLKKFSRRKHMDSEECLVPELESPHKKFPCASDAIDVRFSETFGRYIVATRDIEIGEVLVVEKPYFRYNLVQRIYTNCSYCLRNFWGGVPCEHCVMAVYCSENCKTLAWNKYHHWECDVFDLIKRYEATENFANFLGSLLRLLLHSTVEAGGIEQFKERLNNLPQKSPIWPLKEEWYQNYTLETVFALTTNEEKGPFSIYYYRSELVKYSMVSLRIIFLLATCTTYFGSRYDDTILSDAEIASRLAKNDNVKFLGGVLVKMIFRQLINSYPLDEYDAGEMKPRGIFGLPFISLFNHSCYGNIEKQNKRENIVIYASLPIKKGEQVFDFYGQHFAVDQYEQRQIQLKKTFRFDCNCIACVQRWPLMESMKDYRKQAKSTQAKHKIAKAVRGYPAIKQKIIFKDLQDKDKMLKELQEMLKTVYEGVEMPCQTVFEIMTGIRELYYISGAAAKMCNHHCC